MAVGPLDLQAYLFEHKKQQAEAMRNAKRVVKEVSEDFERTFGRHYEFFERYYMDDAELVVVAMNSTAGTAKAAINELRSQGIRAGLIKVRMFRPFPAEEIAEALKNASAIAVLDKSDSLNGCGGALYEDVVSTMFTSNIHVPTVNYVYGICGRDTTTDHIKTVFTDLRMIADTKDIGNPYRYLGLREE